VAEGVECAEQLEVLRDIGVEHAQGFYLGHPRAPQDVTLPSTDLRG
jgi:EAL domain-containing protein (putative c-di-GMP-specific phosphodiesterase class I)